MFNDGRDIWKISPGYLEKYPYSIFHKEQLFAGFIHGLIGADMEFRSNPQSLIDWDTDDRINQVRLFWNLEDSIDFDKTFNASYRDIFKQRILEAAK